MSAQPASEPRARLWGLPRDHALFVVMMVGLVVAKVPIAINADDMLIDGGYYTDVARNVRDGLGLVSNISLYHAGVDHFPHPTSVYPLWPLLYGYAARFADLAIVGHGLPTLMYFIAVVGAYLFGRAWDGADLFPSRFPGLNAGHVVAAMLALHREFVIYTALPYTEGLAWALMMFFLWRLLRTGASRSLGSAAEIGVWLSLLVLCRTQFVLAPLAVGAGFLVFIVAGPDRRRTALRGAIALGMVTAVVAAHLAWVRTWLPGAGPLDLLRFDQAQVTDMLDPVTVLASTQGPLEFVLDRIAGVYHAYDPIYSGGYQRAWFTFQWALAFAAPFAALGAVRSLRRDGLAATLEKLSEPAIRARTITVLLAGGALLSIHLAHKVYNGEWYFHRRQALVCLFAFALSLIWLLRSSRALAYVAGVVVLCSGTVQGVELLIGRTDDALKGEPLFEKHSHANLVSWLNARSAAEGRIVVALQAQDPQRLAWRTEGVGYHWFYENTRYDDLRKMFDHLGARYLIYGTGETSGWLFRNDDRFSRDFVKLPDSPDSMRIYTRR